MPSWSVGRTERGNTGPIRRPSWIALTARSGTRSDEAARPWLRQMANYTLTFSRTEANEAECFEALAHGVNVAVIFDTKRGRALPSTYYGMPVVDGDLTDLRYLDPRGVVIGLRAKGKKAKADRSGMVVRVATLPASDRAVEAA